MYLTVEFASSSLVHFLLYRQCLLEHSIQGRSRVSQGLAWVIWSFWNCSSLLCGRHPFVHTFKKGRHCALGLFLNCLGLGTHISSPWTVNNGPLERRSGLYSMFLVMPNATSLSCRGLERNTRAFCFIGAPTTQPKWWNYNNHWLVTNKKIKVTHFLPFLPVQDSQCL